MHGNHSRTPSTVSDGAFGIASYGEPYVPYVRSEPYSNHLGIKSEFAGGGQEDNGTYEDPKMDIMPNNVVPIPIDRTRATHRPTQSMEDFWNRFSVKPTESVPVDASYLEDIRHSYLGMNIGGYRPCHMKRSSVTFDMEQPLAEFPGDIHVPRDGMQEPPVSSPFRGVSYKRKEGKWVSQIKFKSVQHYLGIYHTPEEAARVYDIRAREYYGERTTCANFASDKEAREACIEASKRNGTEFIEPDKENKRAPTSSYRGVSFKNKDQKWVSQIRHSGKQFYLGIFETEIAAAQAYDKAAAIYHKEKAKLNFAPSVLVKEETDMKLDTPRHKRQLSNSLAMLDLQQRKQNPGFY